MAVMPAVVTMMASVVAPVMTMVSPMRPAAEVETSPAPQRLPAYAWPGATAKAAQPSTAVHTVAPETVAAAKAVAASAMTLTDESNVAGRLCRRRSQRQC